MNMLLKENFKFKVLC